MAFLIPIGTALGVGGGGMAAGVAGGVAVAGAAASVATAATSIISATNKSKIPGAEKLPDMPTPANSLLQAQQDADNRRRASILSGGNTQLTPMGMLQPQGQRRTLLGE